eukprot:scaffold23310_cov75-Phaeocystis_antarctica.AAC.1
MVVSTHYTRILSNMSRPAYQVATLPPEVPDRALPPAVAIARRCAGPSRVGCSTHPCPPPPAKTAVPDAALRVPWTRARRACKTFLACPCGCSPSAAARAGCSPPTVPRQAVPPRAERPLAWPPRRREARRSPGRRPCRGTERRPWRAAGSPSTRARSQPTTARCPGGLRLAGVPAAAGRPRRPAVLAQAAESGVAAGAPTSLCASRHNTARYRPREATRGGE